MRVGEWGRVGGSRGVGGALALAVLLSALPPSRLPAQEVDSLISAAQRAARAWRDHDFRSFVGASTSVALALPGSPPTAPLRAGQAAQVLMAFAEGADEVDVEVMVARLVDAERAYVEIRRVFRARGSEAPRSQTLYLGMRRAVSSYQVAEVRIVQ